MIKIETNITAFFNLRLLLRMVVFFLACCFMATGTFFIGVFHVEQCQAGPVLLKEDLDTTSVASSPLLFVDFEDGEIRWPGDYEIVNEGALHGKKACKIASGHEERIGFVCQFVPLKPKTSYTYSMAVKRANGAGNVYAYCHYLGKNKKPLMSSGNWTAGKDVPVSIRKREAISGWEVFFGDIRCDRADFGGVRVEIVVEGGDDIVSIDRIEISETFLPEAPCWEMPQSVFFDGHPSRHGMRVKRSANAGDTFVVETTGAIYELNNSTGNLRCYQNGEKPRLIQTTKFSRPFQDLRIERTTPDVCVLQGRDLCLGIQGDSLVTIVTNTPLKFDVESAIEAKHFRKTDQHLLAIDSQGGFCIMPHTRDEFNSSGSILLSPPKDTTKPGWRAGFLIAKGEMVGISVFPPKPFSWERSFDLRIVMTMQPPPAGVLQRYRDYANVLSLFTGTYTGTPQERYHAPYQMKNALRLKRTIDHAHKIGMKVLLYRHMMSYLWDGSTCEAAFEDMKRCREAFGFDGWYLDGLFVDKSWVDSYRFIRKLRDEVGDGVIYTHSTRNAPFQSISLYCPFIDVYSDFQLRGEGQDIYGECDPYLRYVVGTYNISNSIATLKGNRFFQVSTKNHHNKRSCMPLKEQLRIMLQLNGRCRWAYPVWPLKESDIQDYIGFYYPELERLEKSWLKDHKPLPIQLQNCFLTP